MIEFSQTDFNLSRIRHETKLANLITRQKYKIYGLRQDNNPLVLIEFNNRHINENFNKRLNTIINFFKGNGIDIETYNQSEYNRIDIGLRRDLRGIVNSNKQPIFAASILSTIVYCLEGRIDLDELAEYKLSQIPKIS